MKSIKLPTDALLFLGLVLATAKRSGGIQVKEAARTQAVATLYVAKIKMVLLTPHIVEAIIEGRAGDRVLLKVLEGTLPVDWGEQRGTLGI